MKLILSLTYNIYIQTNKQKKKKKKKKKIQKCNIKKKLI